MTGQRCLLIGLGVTALQLASCSKVLGLEEFHPSLTGGTGGVAGVGGSGGASGSAGGGGTGAVGGTAGLGGSSGVGGSAGDGSGGTAGAGGARQCEPNSKQACYTGPEGTKGKGLCSAGEQTCNSQGDGYGECAGETLPATEDCGDPDADENCDGFECGVWARSYDGLIPKQVVTAADGNLLIAGRMKKDVIFAGTNHSAERGFVASITPEGTELWLTPVDGEGIGLAADPAGGAYALLREGSGFPPFPYTSTLLALDASGKERWVKAFTENIFSAVAADANGVVISGTFQGTFNAGDADWVAVGADGLLVYYSPGGSVMWSRSFGGAGDDSSRGVEIADGEVHWVGTVSEQYDFGSGAHELFPPYSGYLARLPLDDPGGMISLRLFQKPGVKGTVYPTRIVADGSNAFIISGTFFADWQGFDFDETRGNEQEAFAARITNFGSVFGWQQEFPIHELTSVLVVPGAASKPVVVGATDRTGTFGSSEYEPSLGVVGRLDIAGRPAWTRALGGPPGAAYAATTLPSDEVVVVGESPTAAWDIGGVPMLAGGYVVKLGK